ncbi:TetR/AcrR family transcriptional regulator [Streptomyces uncialis]|uniref:TetR/AcrR family transcriptional regulator n=1 Tax=Streptomyces uncialis TaxID=1048205 RepID=UPI00224EFA50|nr:TetR/AcrR family transcriptional regulator [Streptomyces uncialis]MCX4658618.1 TetR/AcrR family transcriptional regulator [Streptomyces uncialis]
MTAPLTRAEKTRRTRRRMLDAAARLFVERGWTGATVEDIARAAEVGVQTVYFTFGTKRALLGEVLDTAIAGDADPAATLDRPWAREVVAEPDPAAQLARQAAGARRVLERAAPVLEVVRTAATAEPELAALWRTNLEQRHTVQLHFAHALTAKAAETTLTAETAKTAETGKPSETGAPDEPGGPLRDGHDARSAADIMFTVLGPETYGLLVTTQGWSPDRWERWAADLLTRQLLP